MSNASFTCDLTKRPLSGRLVYRAAEYAIDFVDCARDEIALMAGNRGCCSLSLGTLQIEVGVETGRLLYPWGYCPLMNCELKSLPMKQIDAGAIYVGSCGEGLIAGVALEFPGSRLWRMFKDEVSGWICIGDPAIGENVHLIQFSTDALLSFSEKRVTALWIKPVLEMD